jgi:putative tryptophan/tyrosine transport system substrate-binding protein
MRRREFITLLGGAAVAYPPAAQAQQTGKLPTIGVLAPNAPSWGAWIAAFEERLRELGWIEGRTVAIEYRFSDGRPDRVSEVAAEFVQQKADVIVTYGGAVRTFKQATASIPIVFAIAVDPIGIGLVANLTRPDGNVTGLSMQQNESTSKRLELLREIVPGLHRLAIMFDGGYPASVGENGEVQVMARSLGLEAAPHELRRPEDIAPLFDVLKGQADALYVVESALTIANSMSIVTLALSARLPTIYTNAETARAGGLISYGPNVPELFRRAADYVDKILRGAKPGELPVEQPTKFDLVINLKTAKALGLTIPDKLLAIANDVVEE